MKNSFNAQIGSENPATLSPTSYPPSLNFEHQSEKAEKQKASCGNVAGKAEG
jgi:hypothetical protein